VESGITFYIDGQAVGYFLDSPAPVSDGEYAYMPFRGPGHLNLMTQLQSSHAPRCHYLFDGKRVEFSVVAQSKSGLLRLAGFEVSGAEAEGRAFRGGDG
jgi:hypothetical protein